MLTLQMHLKRGDALLDGGGAAAPEGVRKLAKPFPERGDALPMVEDAAGMVSAPEGREAV